MEDIIQVKYALDTFYFLICGALVMWMAAGFAMLEAGLVRSKNTTEILTKNIALYAIACTMYLLCGYTIMYGGSEGGILPDAWFGNSISDATVEVVLGCVGVLLLCGCCCHGDVDRFWRRCRAHEAVGFLGFRCGDDRCYLPTTRYVEMGRRFS
jgi:hypothetical protein